MASHLNKLLLIGLCIIAQPVLSAPPAPASYSIVGIDSFYGNYVFYPTAINNQGKVVGMGGYRGGSGPSASFSWTESGGRIVEAAYHSEYRDINNKGDIAGTISGSNMFFRPTIKTASGKIYDYLHPGKAVSVNDIGYAAVSSAPNNGLWDYVNKKLTPISFEPYAINNQNQIVGRKNTNPNKAMLYTPANGEIQIGSLDGASIAYAINDAGVVVGWSYSTTGSCTTGCGFIYDSINGMRTLPKLSSARAEAKSVNLAGDAVGVSTNSSNSRRAVLWNNSRVIDLNSRIPATSGWALSDASAINDNGQIVGFGTHNGVTKMFVLTPRSCSCLP